MNVVLADLEGDALREAAKSVGQSGARTLGVVTDVSHPDALRELADRTLEEFGAVCAFLASQQASYVTGSLVRCDGGAIKSV